MEWSAEHSQVIINIVAPTAWAELRAWVSALLPLIAFLFGGVTFEWGRRNERMRRRKDIRKSSFEAELWPAVQNAMNSLKECCRNAEALSRTDISAVDDFTSRVWAIHETLTPIFEQLISSLQDIDASFATHECDWALMAQNVEESVHDCLAAAAQDGAPDEDRCASLVEFSSLINKLIAEVRRRRENQLEEFV